MKASASWMGRNNSCLYLPHVIAERAPTCGCSPCMYTIAVMHYTDVGNHCNLAIWQCGNLAIWFRLLLPAFCCIVFSDFGNHDNLAIWLSDVDSLCLFSCVAFGLRQRGTTIKCVQRLGLRGILFAQSSCVDGGHLDRSSTTRAPMQTYTSPRPPSNTRPIWQSGMQSDNPVPEPANRVGGEPTPNAAGRRNTHEDHQWLIYIYI